MRGVRHGQGAGSYASIPQAGHGLTRRHAPSPWGAIGNAIRNREPLLLLLLTPNQFPFRIGFALPNPCKVASVHRCHRNGKAIPPSSLKDWIPQRQEISIPRERSCAMGENQSRGECGQWGASSECSILSDCGKQFGFENAQCRFLRIESSGFAMSAFCPIFGHSDDAIKAHIFESFGDLIGNFLRILLQFRLNFSGNHCAD